MKILIAPDSFKGSNTSAAVAARIEAGILRVFPDAQTVKIPIADGGEGTVEALVLGAGGEYHTATVCGPMGKPVSAVYGVLPGGVGVIEMAAAAGLPLVPESERNPMTATTYGVGELLLETLKRGCRSVIIGLGGSATNDGGVGMAQALGVSFKDKDGNELPRGAAALSGLAHVDVSGVRPLVLSADITIASDVTSPLCGLSGATRVFGAQKGANGEMIETLDAALAHLASVVSAQLNRDFSNAPGAGAAGGLGYGLMAFLGAKTKAGIETVMDCVDMDTRLIGCDLVITGEGRIDSQSVFGKVPVGVALRAKKYGIPVIAIVGNIGDGAAAVYNHGIDSMMSTVNKVMTLEQAFADCDALLEEAAERAMRMIKIGMDIQSART